MKTSRNLFAVALVVAAGAALAQPAPSPMPNFGAPPPSMQGGPAGHPAERPAQGPTRPGMHGGGPAARGMPPPMDGEHFPNAKAFAQKTVGERLRVLQDEQRCIEAANDAAALRKCHEAAREARKEMMERNRPQFEQLRQGAQR